MSNGLTKAEEKNLRDTLARVKKVYSRGAHFSWTERNALFQSIEAIEKRLSPVPVSALLETATRVCQPLEFLLAHSIDHDAELEAVG
jgi:hypothetical protein